MSNDHLIHMLFDRHLSERAAIVTLMTTDPPFLDPFFLDIRLAALRAYEDALFKQHATYFFHVSLAWMIIIAHHRIGSCRISRRQFALLSVRFLGLPFLHFLFKQHASKHFPDNGLRKRRAELDLFRQLEFG
jgi:hypothetical protein